MLVVYFLLLATAASASQAGSGHHEPCSNFPSLCIREPSSPCSEDDEDCTGSGSGSGDSSGSKELKVCVSDNGRTMILVGCDTTTPTPVSMTTPSTVTVRAASTPTQSPPVQKPDAPSNEVTKTPPDIVTPVRPVDESKEVTTTMEISTKSINPSNTEISTKLINPKDNLNNKETQNKEEDDTDKTWMIGVIVGCVIGSAILGVLAAVVVIKLKFSGQQSGSYHSNERGSTGSSSSQKPLYV